MISKLLFCLFYGNQIGVSIQLFLTEEFEIVHSKFQVEVRRAWTWTWMWRTGWTPSSPPTQTPTGTTGYGCCLPLGLHRILNRADIRPTFLPYIRLNSYIRICINIYFLLWYMFFLILFVFCFNLKQSFLAGYPANETEYPPGYRI